jgi:preprotein translocase subunit YajC
MIASITRGDKIVTAGGFFGKVLDVLDDSYILELDAGVRARILKSSVSSKREGDDKPRPKKLRKKRRVVRHENAAESERPAETGEMPQASLEEGVSMEENEALIEEPRGSEGADETKHGRTDGDGGNSANAETK